MTLGTLSWALGVMLLLRVGQMLLIGGLVRSKNAASACVRLLLDLAVVTLAAWAIGGAFASGDYPRPWITFGNLLGINGTMIGVTLVPLLLIATAAPHGAAAERTRLSPLLAIAAIFGIVGPLLHQIAQRIGLPDTGVGMFALLGGAAATVVAIVAGPRKGKFNRDLSVNFVPGHNVVLQVIGALLVIAGVAAIAGYAAPQVLLGTSAATLAAAGFGRLKFGKIDTGLTLAGTLAGAIAGGVAPVPTWLAVLGGAGVGMLAPWLLMLMETRFRIDDVTASSSTLLSGAIVGVLAAIVYAFCMNPTWWVIGWGVSLVLLPVVGGAIALGVSVVFRGMKQLRISESAEYDGTDLAELDLNAYPDFQQTMIKSYHMREM